MIADKVKRTVHVPILREHGSCNASGYTHHASDTVTNRDRTPDTSARETFKFFIT
jgi:hypothetical protein